MRNLLDYYHDFYRPILGGKKYEDWERESFKLQKVKIKNKKLALELEEACGKKGGFLTYAEYLEIEQFGENGYHNTHVHHGFTPTYKAWEEGIFNYLTDHDIHTIVEMGPGNGNLAYGLFKRCQKHNFRLSWKGIEVLDSQRELIEKRFKDKKYKDFFGGIVKNVNALPYYNSALIISSFCIDSVPPEILTNTKKTASYPNAVIGVTIKDGLLEEFILSGGQLSQKNMQIQNGIFTAGKTSFDIKSFKLSPMQRAYITFEGFNFLHEVVKKVKTPTVLIIDEVRTSPGVLRSDHLLSPLYLNIKNRYKFNPHNAYHRSGEFLYYYPLFLSSILSSLKSMGLKHIELDIDPKISSELAHKKWVPDKKIGVYLCYGIIASGKPQKITTIKLLFPKPQGL